LCENESSRKTSPMEMTVSSVCIRCYMCVGWKVYNVLAGHLVAHACNPSYLEGWDLKDHSWRPTQANSSQDLISKNNQSKMD
jgi:hypothetical protein